MATRRRKQLLLVLAGLAVLGLAAGIVYWLQRPGKPNAQEEPERVFDGSSTLLRQTVLVSTLDTPTPDDHSAIWCLSFQLAWNRLKEDVVKEPVQLSGSQEVADRLNRAAGSEADVPEGDYLAMAGAVDDGIVEKIESALARKFPRHTMRPISGIAGGYVAVGYLKAEVRYTYQFLDNPEWLPFTQADGRAVPVRSFGLPQLSKTSPVWGSPRDQVRVLFRDGGEFVVDLSHASAPNQVLLAKVPRRGSLVATLADLKAKLAGSQPAPLPRSATLLVPNMNWRVEHDYDNLEGRTFLNAGMGGRRLVTAFQFVDFRLDRFGAAVESGALLGSDNGHTREEDPDRFHFDRPFLIVMKKRDAERPFFVMWVDNAELLCGGQRR